MKWREWFLRKARLQILALFLAMVAWFLVHSGQTVKQRNSFELDFHNLSQSYILLPPTHKQVDFVLTGSFHRLRNLEESLRVYPIDLSNYRPGRHFVQVDPSHLRLPLEIQAAQPNPPRIEFEVDERAQKDLPLDIRTIGEPHPDFRVSQIRVEPDPLPISGPRSLVAKLERYQVDVSVEGLDRSINLRERVTFESRLIEGPSHLSIEVELQSAEMEVREFELPVVGDDRGRSLRIEPPLAQVRLEGPTILFEETDDLRVVVPVEGLQRNRRLRIRGRLQAPEGIRLLKLEPESFIVEAFD